ncbi:MAG: ribonuclease PH [Actinomycetota bacterium]|nr:ribonuclease PH [Actinomycetota bacterium]MDK1017430.1 ribonuclease PH [Actinomycetota bacterium]MDK1027270.1 ribonuclease PH [Actinomycetota bacterium]MDK1039024.1 ribonuclease PH [Actinomycetota bacterium]MDK1097564.1 ribonuclease PH [Actinomycetota bacterium]
MRTERANDELRTVKITRGFTEMTPGSVLIEMGRTRVLCTVSLDDEVPPWMRKSGGGWVTAEYSMLPGASPERIRRSSVNGGRTKEIQRLIGRSLRAAVDMEAMGPVTARIDCDVLQADGGTRTAAITGAWIALADAFDVWVAEGKMEKSPIKVNIAAISVGVVDGVAMLDLDYTEDVGADVDANVVMTGDGRLIEVQGTAEGDPFTREQLDAMLDFAGAGIESLVSMQNEARA